MPVRSDPLLSQAYPGLTLLPNERLLRGLRPDLDDKLRFSPGLVLLSEAHVHRARAGRRISQLRALLYTRELLRHEHGGLTELSSFVDHGERKLCIYFDHWPSPPRATISLAAFEETRGRHSVVRAPLDEDSEDEYSLPQETAPVGHPLWRLFGFARQRFGKIAIGLALTLATTVVGLIPPYLTMPLVDRVLVPWQESHGLVLEAAYHSLWLYLGGLAGAAVLAWLLAWAQGAVLAWVSELISADLRNSAFSHLQRLSLQYFGGKRTGDLINRISSETDRLCSFLSDTLIDFPSPTC